MGYIVSFSDRAEIYLASLQKDIAVRIKEKILTLELVRNPRKYLRPVEGMSEKTYYRYRVGDYRAFHTFNDDELIILVIEIGKRENVYFLRPPISSSPIISILPRTRVARDLDYVYQDLTGEGRGHAVSPGDFNFYSHE